jgi:hypothetical protein
VQGCKPVTRTSRLVPALSFPDRFTTPGVGKQPAVDHIRQLAFQRTHRLTTALTLAKFTQVVITALATVADLRDRGQVNDLVELAVAATVVPVADDVTRGGV